ncbi:MAG TPA: Holliday junction resolvase RuvX [Thermoanaerobaculia bacterium]|nr:Holliday junction resolvase RuvX [Thermoanaerobaculia bacterium]
MSFLAVDMGSRRVGIAVSVSGVLATPHSVIANRGDLQGVLDAIAELADELEVGTIVLGIPRSKRMDASATEARFESLAEALRQRTCKEVVLWDEALTTVEATSRLRSAGKKGRRLDSRIDMEAASIILQSYLDARHRRLS